MASKFELFRDKSGSFRFASSESCSSRSAAEAGIDSVKKIAPDAEVVDRV